MTDTKSQDAARVQGACTQTTCKLKNPLLGKYICGHIRLFEAGQKTYTVEIECSKKKEMDKVQDFLVGVRDAKR